jgi:glycosyltransferase involved in cell wall biosynthesis
LAIVRCRILLSWGHGSTITRYWHPLITPIKKALGERGYRVETICFKFHDHETYRRLLVRSRAMVFLCEHETQGLAYQEALASNVPVLARDNGYWLDPLWRRVSETMVPASSVPFFSPDCGKRFANFAAFVAALSRFLERLPSLRPRQYGGLSRCPRRH